MEQVVAARAFRRRRTMWLGGPRPVLAPFGRGVPSRVGLRSAGLEKVAAGRFDSSSVFDYVAFGVSSGANRGTFPDWSWTIGLGRKLARLRLSLLACLIADQPGV